MRIPPFGRHLMHANRRCRFCVAEARKDGYEAGYRHGFHAAAVDAERRERHIRELVASGVDPWQLERDIRERAA